MSREEEIEKQSERIANNSFYVYDPMKPKATMKSCCKYMADWCDSHPRKGLWDGDRVIAWLKENIDEYYMTNEFEEFFDSMYKDLKEAMED